jgi:hypothetical protein
VGAYFTSVVWGPTGAVPGAQLANSLGNTSIVNSTEFTIDTTTIYCVYLDGVFTSSVNGGTFTVWATTTRGTGAAAQGWRETIAVLTRSCGEGLQSLFCFYLPVVNSGQFSGVFVTWLTTEAYIVERLVGTYCVQGLMILVWKLNDAENGYSSLCWFCFRVKSGRSTRGRASSARPVTWTGAGLALPPMVSDRTCKRPRTDPSSRTLSHDTDGRERSDIIG